MLDLERSALPALLSIIIGRNEVREGVKVIHSIRSFVKTPTHPVSLICILLAYKMQLVRHVFWHSLLSRNLTASSLLCPLSTFGILNRSQLHQLSLFHDGV
jgi:uncharacterized membrane protein